VCELDSQGRFAYGSPNFQDVLGYEPPALIGTSPFPLIHPDDRERVIQQFANAISENAPPGTSIFRLRRADDAWSWLEVSANFFKDDQGDSRAVILARDIAERMAMEETLRESEERLRVFVENVPVILFASDAEGVFTLYEGAGLERVGLRPGQFVGRSIFEVHADTPRVGENLRRALAGEAFSDLVQIGGVTFEAHHTPLRDAAGVVTGMIGVLIDATARVRAEEARRESDARLRTFVSNAPLVLFGTDRDGVFTIFDGKGTEALGVDPSRFVGQSIFEALAEFPEMVASARRVLAGETRTFVFRGQRMAMEVHHAPVLDDADDRHDRRGDRRQRPGAGGRGAAEK
jgi:PAS domain S-box-containing protein